MSVRFLCAALLLVLLGVVRSKLVRKEIVVKLLIEQDASLQDNLQKRKFSKMSRTLRNKRPQFYKTSQGKTRDGSRQHASVSCEHHGGCPYCLSNRRHSTKRRDPSFALNY